MPPKKKRQPAGRPRTYESEPLVTLTAKVSASQRDKFRRLKLSARLRGWIDRVKE